MKILPVILASAMAGAVAAGRGARTGVDGAPNTGAAGLSSGPICSVKREVYIPSPQPGLAPVINVKYLGEGLRRREIIGQQGKSDLAEKIKARFSDDNGRTWSPPVPLGTGPDSLRQGENFREDLYFAVNFDPQSRRTIEMVFQRIFLGEPAAVLKKYWRGEKQFYDHMLYRLSADEGRTWTALQPLVHEPGAAFDPANWANPGYLHSNEMYGSYAVTILRNGQIAYPVSLRVPCVEDEEDKKIRANFPKYASAPGYVGGVSCFLGKWNPQKNDYEWTVSNPVFVPLRISTRGLGEPIIAELQDGTLLLEMRGSNDGLDPVKYPGRKWISISKNGGHDWSPVTDLRYDTGEQFYAPGSLAKFVRSHKTGKLYWIGNISRQPPKGGIPRYPLYIAEVDEHMPALKKSTLTVIDDRQPEDTAAVQFSNFSLLENRETQDVEVFLTRLGEKPGSAFSANAYKYVLTFR
ncbi:MAG: sialidase family protein [Opitutaceae bacterium]|nr:sialidase family protein [Opitutaceae bacterium]